MTRRFLCLLLTLLMLLQCYGIFAAAEEIQSTEAVTSVSETPSTESTQPPTESTQPPTQSTQPPAESTPPSTESTQPPEANTTPTTPPAACSHTYGGWSTSEGAHSRTCTKCGHVESAGHSWYAETVTVAPTCKDAGGKAKVCTVCELILITEITPPLTTHTYDTACDDACNVCGQKREVTHTYSAAWTKNAKGHWHACTVCGAQDEVRDHYPGPAATEEKEQICLTCGYVMMQKKNHTHKLDTAWSSDTLGHWHACTGCSEQKDYADHTYGDGCDTDCNICGFVRATAHMYEIWQTEEKTHSSVCTLCGEESPKEAHSPNALGTNCSVCGYALEATEPTHIHSFEEDTWGLDDYGHWKTCICGEKQQAEPHSWDEGREEKDMRIVTCSICGAQRQEPVQESGFPWLLLLAGIVIAAAAAGIVICVVLLRKQGKYSR